MANGDFGGALGFNTGRSRVGNPFLDEGREPGGFNPRVSLGAGFLGEADPPFDFPGGPYSQGALSNLQRLGSAFGRGRRAADRGVQAYENPFGRELADIVRKRDAGDIEGARAHFGEAWSRYRQGVAQGFAQGGKDALVAQQSLDNPLLRQTANEIANSLGLGGLSWGRDRGGTGGAPNLTGGMGSSMFPQQNTGGSGMPGWAKNLLLFGAGKGTDWLLDKFGFGKEDYTSVKGTPPFTPKERQTWGFPDINVIPLPNAGGGGGGAGDPSTGFKAWLEKNFPQIANTGLDVVSTAMQAKLINDYNEEVKRQNFLREGIGAYQLQRAHRAGKLLDPLLDEALNVPQERRTPYTPLPEMLRGTQKT
jgi:hypothetical protein